MKSLNKLAAAFLILGSVGTVKAQLSQGEECGCPDFESRDNVLISTLTDANGNLSANTSLTCDKVYELDQTLYVGDGLTLTIQAGSIIRGQAGTGLDAKSVLISRGGKIMAMGTKNCPIQFTSTGDNLDGTKSLLDVAEWGGLIVLGSATNNLLLADGGLAIADGVGVIEGFDTEDPRAYYGAEGQAFDDNDNSGVIRHVSIRHGGSVVGDPSLGNDINGLTLGSVGRGTTIEYVEVIANFDDGIEFFGGTVDLRYGAVLFSGDDYFDYDHGYTGRNQFLYGLQFAGGDFDQGDEGLEMDGDDENSGNDPASAPVIYNATIIGNASDRGILAKEALEGKIANSIFGNFNVGVDLDNDRATDAVDNFLNGDLELVNNSFVDCPTLLTVGEATPSSEVGNLFSNNGNIDAPGLIDTSFDIDTENGTTVLDAANVTPAAGTASTDEPAPLDDFFQPAAYRGAFAPGSNESWLSGSTIDTYNIDNSLVSCPSDLNNDGEINSGDFLIFSGDFGSSCAIE